MTIRTVPLDQLHPAGYNPRTISPEAYAGLRESIERFGLVQPIVWNERTGNVVSGHQRLKVLHDRGDAETVVVVVDLPELDERALNITQNNPAVAGDWDLPKLDGLLAELCIADYNLPALRLDTLGTLAPPPTAEPIEAESYEEPADRAQAKWNVKPGDIWECGAHRILCGDSGNAADVARVMGGDRATVVFTDPPYGVAIGAKNRMLQEFKVEHMGRGPARGGSRRDLDADALAPDELRAVLTPAFVNTRELAAADDCTYFVTAPQGGELGMMMMMLRDAGLPVRHVLIWRKDVATFSMGRLDYDYAHEPILLTWTKRHKRPLQGPFRTSVWELDKPRSSPLHPTMKPVGLYTNALLNHSDPGDVLFDPFAGSGTALLAAEQEGRAARAIEIDPVYVAVTLDRFHSATGVAPIRVK